MQEALDTITSSTRRQLDEIEALDAPGSIDDEVAALLVEARSVTDEAEATERLTWRIAVLSPAEIVVADLVASGCTNREIGERLYVSRRTVESHIAHAFQKLGVTSRTQLATLMLASRHSSR